MGNQRSSLNMLRFLFISLLIVAATAFNVAVPSRCAAISRVGSPVMMPKFLKDLFPDLPKPGEIRVLGTMGGGLTLFPLSLRRRSCEAFAKLAPHWSCVSEPTFCYIESTRSVH